MKAIHPRPALTVPRYNRRLLDDALQIWRVGVESVAPAVLIPQFVRIEGDTLWIDRTPLLLKEIRRIVIVGAGKASGAMAAAVEQSLGQEILNTKKVNGLVNVPSDTVAITSYIRLHRARSHGMNEPTEEAVEGTREISKLVSQLGKHDLCICLLSGGGSALLPAPIDGLSLDDKIAITRELSARGATIHELNAVRRELSIVKGGGLARICTAGNIFSLILSDVPGDDLAIIASGPTFLQAAAPDEAIRVMNKMCLTDTHAGRVALRLLAQRRLFPPTQYLNSQVSNILIGSNATAVFGAAGEARRLGYEVTSHSAQSPEGLVESVAHSLVQNIDQLRDANIPSCHISGGEPVVKLAPATVRGLGGRNQQLCLAALDEHQDWKDIVLVSGGTDGEDGPTDAMGACVDETIAAAATAQNLDSNRYLANNDAYHFFERIGGLLKTGATQTNVGDLRIMVSNPTSRNGEQRKVSGSTQIHV